MLDAEEAEAVLRSAEALPLLPRLMDTVERSGDHDYAVLIRARELWDAGSVDDMRSPIRRRLAVSYALPVLLQEMPAEAWPAARTRVDEWVERVEEMLQHLTLPDVESRVRAAEGHLARSDRAGSERNRVYHLLLASSELAETTPRWVARTLAADAAAAVARAQEEGGLSEQVMERAVRLKNWSARAVEEGDYVRAIQRAYYALQLVEGA